MKALFDKTAELNNKRVMGRLEQEDPISPLRRSRIVAEARAAGLMTGGRSQVGARLPARLLAAAKAKAGLTSTTEVVEYALATVALEDDFGAKLLALAGTVDPDLDLDF